MKELRETCSVFALIISIGALFLSISIALTMLFVQGTELNMYLLKFLAVDITLFIVCYSAAWILSDEVWSRKNMPYTERKKIFNLK